jgi:hypothetical protein
VSLVHNVKGSILFAFKKIKNMDSYSVKPYKKAYKGGVEPSFFICFSVYCVFYNAYNVIK